MMRIHDEQLQRLGEDARAEFVTRMSRYLQDHFTDQLPGRSPADADRFVSAAVAKADRFGVRREGPVAQLILLLLVLGADADERLPWVAQALGERELSDLGKVRKLVAHCREQQVHGLERVALVREVCE